MSGYRTYRDKRPIPEGSPASVHPTKLVKPWKHIDVLRWNHVELSRRFLGASDGDLYEIDLVLAGVMVRSYGLLDSFDIWNPVVPAPLLRMQLDNSVRLSCMVRAPRASDVAQHVLLRVSSAIRNLTTPRNQGVYVCNLF